MTRTTHSFFFFFTCSVFGCDGTKASPSPPKALFTPATYGSEQQGEGKRITVASRERVTRCCQQNEKAAGITVGFGFRVQVAGATFSKCACRIGRRCSTNSASNMVLPCAPFMLRL
jgi:hypothetical protein